MTKNMFPIMVVNYYNFCTQLCIIYAVALVIQKLRAVSCCIVLISTI